MVEEREEHERKEGEEEVMKNGRRREEDWRNERKKVKIQVQGKEEN